MYYTDLAMWFIELATIIVGILFVRNQRIARLFLQYLIVDFLILNISFFFVGSNLALAKLDTFLNYANPSISLLELYVYYQYFNLILKNEKEKKFIKFLLNIFSVLLVSFLSFGLVYPLAHLKYISYTISVLEFIFMIMACIFYFLQLLVEESTYSLFHRPSFWIVAGIFIFSVISIPYYLLNTYLAQTKNNYRNVLIALFYNTPLIINFLFLSSAFLCKKRLTI